MQSKATTVSQYLDELPDDRRKALQAVRKVMRPNLDKTFKEGMQYGMIGYFVPHSVYPAGYHCDPKQPLPFASIASQKNHMAIYLMCIYSDPDLESWFREEWAKTGKKLDMGKSCIRFRKIEDIPLEIIGKVIKKITAKKFIAHYESVLKTTTKRPTASKKTASKKKTTKQAATKKKAVRRAAKK